MNIFATHPNPSVSAQWLCDVRQNKMIIESVQMLWDGLRVLTGEEYPDRQRLPINHRKHGSAIWARTSYDNFAWLVAHAMTMSNAYTGRSGKIHKCRDGIVASLQEAERIDKDLWPEQGPTLVANHARSKPHGIDFTHVENPYLAYRLYLTARWTRTDKRMPKWTGDARGCPDWALDDMRGKYGPDNVRERTWTHYEADGPIEKTQRERWKELIGEYAEIYSCVE